MTAAAGAPAAPPATQATPPPPPPPPHPRPPPGCTQTLAQCMARGRCSCPRPRVAPGPRPVPQQPPNNNNERSRRYQPLPRQVMGLLGRVCWARPPLPCTCSSWRQRLLACTACSSLTQVCTTRGRLSGACLHLCLRPRHRPSPRQHPSARMTILMVCSLWHFVWLHPLSPVTWRPWCSCLDLPPRFSHHAPSLQIH